MSCTKPFTLPAAPVVAPLWHPAAKESLMRRRRHRRSICDFSFWLLHRDRRHHAIMGPSGRYNAVGPSKFHKKPMEFHKYIQLEPLAKLPAEYGPRSLFACDGVVLGSLSRLSLLI